MLTRFIAAFELLAGLVALIVLLLPSTWGRAHWGRR